MNAEFLFCADDFENVWEEMITHVKLIIEKFSLSVYQLSVT